MPRPAPERDQLSKRLQGFLAAYDAVLLPSERQLADQLGGSRSTIRLALEQLARNGAVVHVAGKGWMVQRRQTILWLGHAEGANEEILAGLRSVLPAAHWQIESQGFERPLRSWTTPPWDLIDPRRHRAVLLFNEAGLPASVAQSISDAGPLICCLGSNRHLAYDTVCADYAQMSRLLVEEAVRRGHKNIAFLGTRRLHEQNPAFAARVHGYRAAMTAQGLEPDVVLLGSVFDELDAQFARWLDDRHAAGRRPTCCYLSGPGYARRIGRILDRLGLHVPDDMSMAGFGAPDEEELDSSLRFSRYTRIQEPFYALGQAAGLRCLARLQADTAIDPVLTLVPSCLRIGDSIRSLPNP